MVMQRKYIFQGMAREDIQSLHCCFQKCQDNSEMSVPLLVSRLQLKVHVALSLFLSLSLSKQVYKDQLESADRIVHWLALLRATGYICAFFCPIDQFSLHFQHTQTKIRKKKLMKNTNNTNKVPIVQILLHWIKHFLTQKCPESPSPRKIQD